MVLSGKATYGVGAGVCSTSDAILGGGVTREPQI